MEQDSLSTGSPAGRQPASTVFLAFLALGLTSFGGPVAHIGYFREAFVVRRRWMDERGYADLVALCQMLPGPTSSQVGIGIGLTKAGFAGAVAAWIGFTAPSGDPAHRARLRRGGVRRRGCPPVCCTVSAPWSSRWWPGGVGDGADALSRCSPVHHRGACRRRGARHRRVRNAGGGDRRRGPRRVPVPAGRRLTADRPPHGPRPYR